MKPAHQCQRKDAPAHSTAGWRLTGDTQGKTRTWREELLLLLEAPASPGTDKAKPGSNTPNQFKSCSRIRMGWEGMSVSKITQKRRGSVVQD